MLVVASSYTIATLVLTALVDVVTGISRFTVVDDAFMDRGRLVPLGDGLGMNRGLFLLSEGLRRLLRGKPASPRGGTLGLLHGSSLEESSDFITGPTGLGVRWLGHVTKKHGGYDNIQAGLVEDRGFAHPILDDATIDVTSSCRVCVPRARARGFAEVGTDFLVPRRAYLAVRGFARVALLDPQGIALHLVHQGAQHEVAWHSFLQWLPRPPNLT
jgi:hypothetical protein